MLLHVKLQMHTQTYVQSADLMYASIIHNNTTNECSVAENGEVSCLVVTGTNLVEEVQVPDLNQAQSLVSPGPLRSMHTLNAWEHD